MSLAKSLGRTRPAQETLGLVLARYLDVVRVTNRFVHEPADIYGELTRVMPFIGAMWHGHHFMIPFLRRPHDRVASLVSRSGDGELNAVALRHLGVRSIRGSGARGRDQRAKGGAPALRAMLRGLQDGETVFLTADVPKIARRCGEGIVTLARISGRPIVPVAVATSRHMKFNSWDRASIGLPFGRGAMVAGTPIAVPRDSSPEMLEDFRLATERELNWVNARACALVGQTDPGARQQVAAEAAEGRVGA